MSFGGKLWLAASIGITLQLGAMAGFARGQAATSDRTTLLTMEGAINAAVSERYDPPTGVGWLLLRDACHPGGPGRMIAVRDGSMTAANGINQGLHPQVGKIPATVIRGGDRIVVEEHTQVADVNVEAVALGPARAGKLFQARTRAGGVVRAIARGAGRATLAPWAGEGR